MKIKSAIVKSLLQLFANIIRKNPDVLNYLFSKALSSETKEFYYSKFFSNYSIHIEKAIQLLKKWNPDRQFCIVDVGGSNGNTAKLFRNAFKDYPIYVFEPVKESFNLLKKSFENDSNIFARNKAIGFIIGKINMNVAKRKSSSSIFALKAGENDDLFHDSLENVGIEEVEISTLDREIPSTDYIGILKLDVQGYELEVLKGGQETLARTMIIVLELNNHDHYTGAPKYYELDEQLRNNGFSLSDICPSTMDNEILIEWDAIYINKRLYEDRHFRDSSMGTHHIN
jgi:FkbM family methyltransferase